MKWQTLSTESTLLMKGIAILMIATHNFMHLFPKPKENEFDFSFDRTSDMIQMLWTEPQNSLQVLFSYFGHFGVALFIFLSAYGLTKKHINQPPIYWPFIVDRFRKIFPAFIIAIVIWLTLEGFYSYGIFGPFKMLYWNFQDILLKLTLVSNFLPDKAQAPIGPWWFIPFIFQFYFIFPYLLKIYHRWKELGLFVLSVFCLVFTDAVNGYIFGVNLYYTILPFMPVFALGLFLAKHDATTTEINITNFIILFSLVIFIVSNVNQHIWVLSYISFTLLFLVALNAIMPKIKGKLYTFLKFTGQISMGLFLVNGFLRFPMLRWAIKEDNWLLTIALCLVFLVISYAVAITLHKIESIISKRMNRPKTVLKAN